MKARWPVFFSIAALLLIAGLLSGNRIFYVLLFGQGALLLCALILSTWAALTFTYLQKLSSETTLRGQPVCLTLEIHNEKPLPYPLMHIQTLVAAEPNRRDLAFNLAPHSHLSFNLELSCPYRGEYAVGMTIIDFLDFFGLLRLPFDMRLLPYYRMPVLLVYPRLVRLTRLSMPALDVHAFSRSQHLTENHDEPFAMVRPYQPGDPGKHIHWKVSLRQRQLMTRIYEQAAEPSVELLLDLSQGHYTGEAARQVEDIFCEAAAALVYYLLNQNWRVKITGYGRQKQQHAGSSLKDFQRLYLWLARVPFDRQQSFTRQLQRDLAADAGVRAILVLTARPEPELGPLLRQVRQRQIPIYSLVACPAQTNPLEDQMAALFHQAGLPAWFVHYGESLERVLQAPS